MRKPLLSIFLLCGLSLFAGNGKEPYLTVRENGTGAQSADLELIIGRLLDVPSFTTMTYYSERRKKERFLFEEASLLSVEPPLPAQGKDYAPQYKFELFLKDASFGDMKWAGEITCTDGVLSMKMTSITPIRFIGIEAAAEGVTPIRFIGIEAAAEGALEIVLNIKKKDTRLSVECLGLARDPIRIISKKRTEQSLRNRLIAFKNYILKP